MAEQDAHSDNKRGGSSISYLDTNKSTSSPPHFAFLPSLVIRTFMNGIRIMMLALISVTEKIRNMQERRRESLRIIYLVELDHRPQSHQTRSDLCESVGRTRSPVQEVPSLLETTRIMPSKTGAEQSPMHYNYLTSLQARVRQGMRASLASYLLALTLICHYPTSVAAAPIQQHSPSSQVDWRQRALAALTDALLSCAFLTAPTLILVTGGTASWVLLWMEAEYTLAACMYFTASVFATIRVDPNAEAPGSGRFERMAIGGVYMFFMLAYCRRVILRHDKGKGTSAIATLIGLVIALGLLAVILAVPPIKKAWDGVTDLEPPYVVPLVVPIGFLLCDLQMDATKAYQPYNQGGAPQTLEQELEGNCYDHAHATIPYDGLRGTRVSESSWQNSRRRLFSRSRYDDDAEEYHMESGTAGGGASEVTAPSVRVLKPGNWLTHLFSPRRGRYI